MRTKYGHAPDVRHHQLTRCPLPNGTVSKEPTCPACPCSQNRLQALPHTAPLTVAVMCIALLLLPLPNGTRRALFQFSIVLVGLATGGYVLTILGNDYSHWRHGLLSPQKQRTVTLMIVGGVAFALLRIVHLIGFGDTNSTISTEHLQRIAIGLPYFFFRFFGLDMWGWAIGFTVFTAFVTFGFLGCCLFNCCGSVRAVQAVFRRRRDAMPFMDMVSNRFTLSSFNALLFLYPFCLLSTFVLGGSLLIEPTRSFANAGPLASMNMLCSPVVTSHFYDFASNAVRLVSTQVLPPDLAGEQARAVGSVLLDLAWRHAFEPIESECDGVVAIPLPPSTAMIALPRLAFSLRDTHGLAAGLAADAAVQVVHVELRRQPRDTMGTSSVGVAAAATGANASEGADSDRPWCVNELAPWLGCAPHLDTTCTTSATLHGRTVVAAGPPTARAGVVVFDALVLEAQVGAELCSGDYELRVAVRDWYGDYDVHTSRDGLEQRFFASYDHDPSWNVTAAADDLGSESLVRTVDVRLVPSVNHTSVRTSTWQVELPAFFNTSDMTRTSSLVHYEQSITLHEVTTLVTHNTTVVGFEWPDPTAGPNTTGAANATDSAASLIDRIIRPHGIGEHMPLPVWPSNTTEPVHVTDQSMHTRSPAHLLSFIKAPPRNHIHLKTPFEVALRLTTEGGFSLSGEQVQAVLLAPIGSGAVLAPGAYGYTDASGVATFNITVSGGVSGSYLLLFGSSGTMQAEPRRDIGKVLGAIADVLNLWRQFVEPIAGSVSAAATAVVDGTLHELLYERLDSAMRDELEIVVREVDSCLLLANYTEAQYDREQTVQLSLNITGTPSAGLANLISGIALDDLAWQTFEETTVASETPGAMHCYQRARDVVREAPTIRSEPVEAFSALASGVVQSMLSASGLGTLNEITRTLAPHAADLEAHLAALNQTMRLAQATFDHLTDAQGESTSWQQLLRVALLLTFGWGAPPAQLIHVKSGVASVELTAPLAGYALFTSASTEPSRNQVGALKIDAGEVRGEGVVSSACVQDGYPSFMPPLRSDTSGIPASSFVDRARQGISDSANLVSALPLASPLWQPPLFLSQNWLLDASAYLPENRLWHPFNNTSPHMGRSSPLCASSFLTYNQPLPGTTTDANTARVAQVVADPLFPRYEAAAAFVEALNGSSAAVASACANASAGRPVVYSQELSPLDAEVCGFAQYLAAQPARFVPVGPLYEVLLSELPNATNATANATNTTRIVIMRGDPPPPPHVSRFSARPKLIVRGIDGEPLAGRYCTVRDESGNSWGDVLSLVVTVDRCGPSNADGEIEIEGLRVRGGATRELHLTPYVEGTRASLSEHTYWARDARLFYFSADQPTFSQINLVTLQGHDSVRLLALLAMPLFALNSRSRRGPPHLAWRLMSIGAFSYFLWISLCLFQRLVGPVGLDWAATEYTSLFAMGTNDLTPIRSGTREPFPLLLAVCNMALTVWLSVCIAWLLIRHERDGIVLTHKKVVKEAIRGARRSVAAFQATGAQGAVHVARRSVAAGKTRLVSVLPSPATLGAKGRFRRVPVPRIPLRRPQRRTEPLTVRNAPRLVCGCIGAVVVAVSQRLVLVAAAVGLAKRGPPQPIPGAPWLEPSPGYFGESEATRRARCARNHVRTMLRGRGSYDVYRRRRFESFFYPQRLWMALALSLWIQLLITLFFINTIKWARAALSAAREFDEKVMAEAQHHAAIDEATRFAPLFRCGMLLTWAFLGGGTDGGVDRGQIVHDALSGVGLGVPLVQLLVLVLSWVHVFVIYRERIMNMRKGVYFFDRTIYREEYANLYIGYQVAGMTLSGFFFLFGGVALAVPITAMITVALTTASGASIIKNQVDRTMWPLFWTLGSLTAVVTFQMVVNLWIFFTGPRSNKWLRHRWWYALYEYNLIFSNTLVGIAVMFTRFVLWLSLGIFCLGRIDLTLLPGPGTLEYLDLGYKTYIAVARQDHRYNNPVCLVFFELMSHHLATFRRKRARRLLRRHFRLTWQLGVVLRAISGNRLLLANRTRLRKNLSGFIHHAQADLEEERRHHRESQYHRSNRSGTHTSHASTTGWASRRSGHAVPLADLHQSSRTSSISATPRERVSRASVGAYARPSRASYGRHLSRPRGARGGSLYDFLKRSRDPAGSALSQSTSTHSSDADDVAWGRTSPLGGRSGTRASSTRSNERRHSARLMDDADDDVEGGNGAAVVAGAAEATLSAGFARVSQAMVAEDDGKDRAADTPPPSPPPTPPSEAAVPAPEAATSQPPAWRAAAAPHRGHHRRCLSDPKAPISALRSPVGAGDGASANSMPPLHVDKASPPPPVATGSSDSVTPRATVAFNVPEGGGAGRRSAASGSYVHDHIHPNTGIRRVHSLHRESATYGAMWDEETFDPAEAEEYLSPMEALEAAQDHADRRRRLVRNRWQLFWVLYRNPVLQGYRAHALAVMAARNTELDQRAKAGKRPPMWRRAAGVAQRAGSRPARGRGRGRPEASPTLVELGGISDAHALGETTDSMVSASDAGPEDSLAPEMSVMEKIVEHDEKI